MSKNILLIDNQTKTVRRRLITGNIRIVSQGIGLRSLVMTDKNVNFNLRKLRDDFPLIRQYNYFNFMNDKIGVSLYC